MKKFNSLGGKATIFKRRVHIFNSEEFNCTVIFTFLVQESIEIIFQKSNVFTFLNSQLAEYGELTISEAIKSI